MAKQPIAPLSIIIPTLNEAAYLPKLLQSIERQTTLPLEIIVADAASTDETEQIAQEAGCTVVTGGLPGIGRNAGATVAKGDFLLFLDADVILPPKFIELALKEFEREYFDVATIITKPISSKHIDQVYFELQRSLMLQLKEHYPFTLGACILVTRRMHKRIGGFDKTLRIGEDNDYGNRARAIGRYGVITTTDLRLSVRRFEKMGRTKLIQTYLHGALLKQLKPLGIDQNVEYEFGNFATVTNLSTAEQFLENLLVAVEKLRSTNPQKKATP